MINLEGIDVDEYFGAAVVGVEMRRAMFIPVNSDSNPVEVANLWHLRLNIEVPDIQRVVLDELAAGLHDVAH